ncbi:MAG: 4-hydroxy-tetrahydrodipicolinate synthase [Dysgonamonadaceae bacterium]|jgi:4-hydroxy-tetrahydrodipicolinate synthase|nr:4-hydroxy-tetrahydrodipicolinate synthase [Dysgonamonadaceae bacterium]
MSKVNLKGVGVALITPFGKDSAIDFDTLAQLVDFQIENGVDYIVALGTTAETPTLSEKEHHKVVRFIVNKVQGKVPVVVGIGGNNTAKLVDTLKTFDFSGVSAILSVTPYYSKPTQEGLYRHYCALSQASPLPIILYNVPGRTGVNMTVETTLRIARDCKNVVATKEASGDLTQIKAIIDGASDGFDVISGDDSIVASVIEMGGIGVISVFANAFPKEMVWLVNNSLKGNAKEAGQKMDSEYNEMLRLMFVEGNPAGIKCLLNLRGMVENEVRLPLTSVSAETEKLIAKELALITNH